MAAFDAFQQMKYTADNTQGPTCGFCIFPFCKGKKNFFFVFFSKNLFFFCIEELSLRLEDERDDKDEGNMTLPVEIETRTKSKT